MAMDNKLLGQFNLVGIPPAPSGMPQIEVTFDIDANGLVNVAAQDKATGKEHSIRIQASGGLSDADIDQMVKDAESHAEEDRKRAELVDAKNQAEARIHSTEKSLEEFAEKVGEEDKETIGIALEELKEAVEGDDIDAINSKSEALAQAAMKLGEAMYKDANPDDAAPDDSYDPSADADQRNDDDIVDADFEEVKDDDSEDKKSA